MSMIHDLGQVHSELVRDTDWLSTCLAGSHAPPPGTVVDITQEADTLLEQVHANAPQRRVIKEYLLQKLTEIPGCAGSNKGKRTKLAHFADALDAATFKLFLQVDVSCFHKLLFDWNKLVNIMNDLGGVSLAHGLLGDVLLRFCILRTSGTEVPLISSDSP